MLAMVLDLMEADKAMDKEEEQPRKKQEVIDLDEEVIDLDEEREVLLWVEEILPVLHKWILTRHWKGEHDVET